jgi:hypothetical protein
MKTYMGVEIYNLQFLCSVLYGGEWLDSRPGIFTPGAPFDEWLSGPQAPVLTTWRKGNCQVVAPIASCYINWRKSLVLQRVEPGPLARSPLLYRYCAIQTPRAIDNSFLTNNKNYLNVWSLLYFEKMSRMCVIHVSWSAFSLELQLIVTKGTGRYHMNGTH